MGPVADRRALCTRRRCGDCCICSACRRFGLAGGGHGRSAGLAACANECIRCAAAGVRAVTRWVWCQLSRWTLEQEVDVRLLSAAQQQCVQPRRLCR